MLALPDDPFSLAEAAAFAPAARRTLALSGTEVELCWLPERRARRGRPGPERPPFPASFAERILATEAIWTGRGLVLTPNRHPFATRQLLLWPETPRREPDRAFLEVGSRLGEQSGGAFLVNSIGAAASIPWCHGHLIGERQEYLPSLALEPLALGAPGDGADVEILRAAAPFPALLIALRGGTAARAAAAEQLLRRRTCPAFGLVSQGDTTWIYPRTAEVPAPHFPQALGTAELWGRWCYDDERAFAAAVAEDLERALAAAGYARDIG